jgi:hypothetical protein
LQIPEQQSDAKLQLESLGAHAAQLPLLQDKLWQHSPSPLQVAPT